MPSYRAPLRDMQFVITELAGLERLATLPGYEEATPDLAEAVLEEAAKLASEVLAPLNQPGDQQGASLTKGGVVAADGFGSAYRQFVENGWNGLAGDPEYGGQGLPALISAATVEIWNSANMSFALCPLLTAGATEALKQHGAREGGAGRRSLSPVRPEDLHHLGRPRHDRQRGPPGAGTYPGCPGGRPRHLAVPGTQVPYRRRGKPGRAQRRSLCIARTQARNPRQPHLRDELRRLERRHWLPGRPGEQGPRPHVHDDERGPPEGRIAGHRNRRAGLPGRARLRPGAGAGPVGRTEER